MPPTHRFEVMDADDPTQPPRVDHLPHQVRVRGVAHHMADGEQDPGTPDRLDDALTLLLGDPERFLGQQR